GYVYKTLEAGEYSATIPGDNFKTAGEWRLRVTYATPSPSNPVSEVPFKIAGGTASLPSKPPNVRAAPVPRSPRARDRPGPGGAGLRFSHAAPIPQPASCWSSVDETRLELTIDARRYVWGMVAGLLPGRRAASPGRRRSAAGSRSGG